jgi:hypothetical protein
MNDEADRHLFDQSYCETSGAREGCNPDTTWMRDTAGQLLLWEAASLRALRQHIESSDVHDLHEQRKDTDAARLYAVWEALRESMRMTVGEVDDLALLDQLLRTLKP